MKLHFKRTQFLKSLYSDIDINNDQELIKAISASYSPLVPEIIIEGELVTVQLPDKGQHKMPNEFFYATDLCTKGKYHDAIPILEKLISQNPSESEYHRNLAQAHEEIGNYQNAIDHLIDALKWDPRNHWALLLMGNIYARHMEDYETAMTYFDQAVEVDPKNHIILSNIGGIFLRADKLTLAKRFFSQANTAQPDFPNALHGLALVEHRKGNLLKAFEFGVSALKSVVKSDDPIRKMIHGFLVNLSSEYMKKGLGKEKVVDFIKHLEDYSGKEIKIEQDKTLQVDAKIEIAENYNRDYHRVVYKNSYPTIDHLIVHELYHLKLIEDARRINANKLFTGGDRKLEDFQEVMLPNTKKLLKEGFPQDKIHGFVEMVFHGVNSRVFNAPIDLFIEDYIYNEYPELRPIQFISLNDLGKMGLQAVTDPKILEITPSSIVSKIKVYNALSARHFDELYGGQTEKEYPMKPLEKQQLDGFWNEFMEYRSDREPGEEYELILHWAEDLELDRYFELKDEINQKTEPKESKAVNDLLKKIEDDPYQMDGILETDQEEMRKFLESNASKKLNLPIVVFMLQALKAFNDMPSNKIEEVAFESAMLGNAGISPEGNYNLKSISGGSLSGNRLLAYYYVSWALIKPEVVNELGLPFEKEYKAAKKLAH